MRYSQLVPRPIATSHRHEPIRRQMAREVAAVGVDDLESAAVPGRAAGLDWRRMEAEGGIGIHWIGGVEAAWIRQGTMVGQMKVLYLAYQTLIHQTERHRLLKVERSGRDCQPAEVVRVTVRLVEWNVAEVVVVEMDRLAAVWVVPVLVFAVAPAVRL